MTNGQGIGKGKFKMYMRCGKSYITTDNVNNLNERRKHTAEQLPWQHHGLLASQLSSSG
jgi:hypothetical protein